MIYITQQERQTTVMNHMATLVCMYVNKLLSAWTEVLTDSGPPSASTCIMASGGRDLGDFRVSGRGW